MKKIDRLGETKINNQGCKMEIIKYENARNIDVIFEDGNIRRNIEYVQFKRGSIKNLYFPQVLGVGFVGEGCYKPRKNEKEMSEEYTAWFGMLERCYDLRYHKKYLTYIGCTVCKEWHNFQVFAQWYGDNKWNNKFIFLDKDILKKGNKEYSPNNCILVNNRINCLFVKCDLNRGLYPIGVTKYGSRHFCSRVSKFENGIARSVNVGIFKNKEEAFECYKKEKEAYIKEVANYYNDLYDNFPKNLYQAMLNYEVEITD